MPTNAHPASRFAKMNLVQVEQELAAMAARYAAEDTARRARNAAILAAL